METFDSIILDTGAYWLEINLDKIEIYNWANLIAETENFIKEFDLYIIV